MREFEATVIKDEKGRLTYVILPFNAAEAFCRSKGTIYVHGTINTILYRGKLISRGSGRYILVVNKDLQKSIGFCGESMRVQMKMSLDDITSNDIVIEVDSLKNSKIDALTAIRNRRSIRKFTKQSISDNILNTILEAGFCAPSAKNKRPWHFVVVKNKEILSKIALKGTSSEMLTQATCGIVVCGDKNLQGIIEFLYQDCSAAIQNMLICIHSLGLGGVWCGIKSNSEQHKATVEQLQLPAKIVPVAAVAFGYPDEVKTQVNRFQQNKIHYERW